eukprot:scaffold36274_cov125-Isochrysis_galbana.AAC.7
MGAAPAASRDGGGVFPPPPSPAPPPAAPSPLPDPPAPPSTAELFPPPAAVSPMADGALSLRSPGAASADMSGAATRVRTSSSSVQSAAAIRRRLHGRPVVGCLEADPEVGREGDVAQPAGLACGTQPTVQRR